MLTHMCLCWVCLCCCLLCTDVSLSSPQLLKTYCAFFARDGSINMWSRSICYRTWISGGFPVSFMLKTRMLHLYQSVFRVFLCELFC